jgi:hypothetical protein
MQQRSEKIKKQKAPLRRAFLFIRNITSLKLSRQEQTHSTQSSRVFQFRNFYMRQSF